MTINQLSIFVENNAGALGKITKVLADNNIDILALSLGETKNYGILRLIVNDTYAAAEALKAEGIVFHLTKVIAAALPHTPGGLSGVLNVLAEKNIDIMYLYAFVTAAGNGATVVLRVADELRETAASALMAAGVKLLDETDIKKN